MFTLLEISLLILFKLEESSKDVRIVRNVRTIFQTNLNFGEIPHYRSNDGVSCARFVDLYLYVVVSSFSVFREVFKQRHYSCAPRLPSLACGHPALHLSRYNFHDILSAPL